MCPVCGLLRINHDCTEQPKTNGAKTLDELRVKSPRKAKPLKEGLATFFAWTDENGVIIKQRGYKDPKLINWAMKNADLYSIGLFEKGGNGHNRNLENQVSVTESFTEIDSPKPLDPKEIIAYARAFGLPPITHIEQTVQQYHYHVHWEYSKPVEKKNLNYWILIQEKIHMVFKSLGADPIPHKDPIRYLRTRKYKTVYKTGRKTSLWELYKAFIKNGMANVIPLNSKKIWRNQKSFNKFSIPTLEKYFKNNPDFVSTHKEVYRKLGIAKSSYFHLLGVIKKAGLQTNLIRVGRTWKTHFTFHGLIKTSLNTGGERNGVYVRSIERAKRVGIVENYRNIGIFVLSLYLKIARAWVFDRVLMELEPVLREIERGEPLGVSRKRRFLRAEFERTVKSAFNPKYTHFCGWGGKSEYLEKVAEWLDRDVPFP